MKFPADKARDEPTLISTTSPGSGQIWLAVTLVITLAAALVLTAPYASRPLANTEMLLPAYAGAVLVIELITAAVLMSLFYVQRRRAIVVLAGGYLYSGLFVIPWALSFPGLFAGFGLSGELQTTAAFATMRRLGFPVFVLAYALIRKRETGQAAPKGAIVRMVGGVSATVLATTWLILSQHDVLPKFMSDMRNVAALWGLVPPAALAMYAAGLAVLLARRRTILDLWMIVVLCTLVIEVVQISYFGAAIRMSVGWWAGRLYGLASASIVLVVMLSETPAVYARLARSVAAEKRARQNRLTAMEALSASIAHELNQPLASMITNADAGLRWLDKPEPHNDEARAALRRIVDEGHRASKVVSGIRTMFTKGARERTRLDLNRIVEQAVLQASGEAGMRRIVIELNLDCSLPRVIGNAIQLQQVLSNLIDNAIEAMRAVTGRQRFLRIVTRSVQHGEVAVSVEDNGPGIEDDDMERIFDPFFTTKSDGMGMGLMFCRTTIEGHGGRLWASARHPAGTIFTLTLPSAADAWSLPGAEP